MEEDEDAQYARDLQLAMELQANEETQAALQKAAATRQNDGFARPGDFQGPMHMLFVICELEGKAVEMLIDSGASTSVISLRMVNQLGLSHRLNPTLQGTAEGVGAAKIVGLVENLVVSMGHVEFRLFFMVLDTNDPWLILGLDQMRRFKCVIDLERYVIAFGGREGVEVPFLDAELAGEAAGKKIQSALVPPAGMTVSAAGSPSASTARDVKPNRIGLRKLFKSGTN
eukprot:scaffold3763_cov165-Amphora_coffeaeformis.AAC.6